MVNDDSGNIKLYSSNQPTIWDKPMICVLYIYSGVHAPRKSAMLGLSSRKYFNENGIHNSDCRIIKVLTPN